MIDAFVQSESPLCVRGAASTVENIKRVVKECRRHGVPVFFIRREYRVDGSDVEISRWSYWSRTGRPASERSEGALSSNFYGPLHPTEKDYVIVKKRWSAFFRTELDLMLRRLSVDTVAITGTQTPNCIRATAYDADMNDFDVIIIEDCVSSNTEDVQRANISDFRNVGFTVIDSGEFIRRIEELKKGSERLTSIRKELEMKFKSE
jgi:nicotinamidase-related amidase